MSYLPGKDSMSFRSLFTLLFCEGFACLSPGAMVNAGPDQLFVKEWCPRRSRPGGSQYFPFMYFCWEFHAREGPCHESDALVLANRQITGRGRLASLTPNVAVCRQLDSGVKRRRRTNCGDSTLTYARCIGEARRATRI